VNLSEADFARLPPHLQALFRKRPNPAADEVLDLFPETRSNPGTLRTNVAKGNIGMCVERPSGTVLSTGDSGSAARFFYCAKASKADRAGSRHPTVKPIKLMQWLCRLITPPDGVILDPFAGSGTTGAAAILEGFNVILVERELEYIADTRNRMDSLELPSARKPTPFDEPVKPVQESLFTA
jgi:DNA modification methylase